MFTFSHELSLFKMYFVYITQRGKKHSGLWSVFFFYFQFVQDTDWYKEQNGKILKQKKLIKDQICIFFSREYSRKLYSIIITWCIFKNSWDNNCCAEIQMALRKKKVKSRWTSDEEIKTWPLSELICSHHGVTTQGLCILHHAVSWWRRDLIGLC